MLSFLYNTVFFGFKTQRLRKSAKPQQLFLACALAPWLGCRQLTERLANVHHLNALTKR